MARTLDFTHPTFALALNQARQLDGAPPIITGVVRLGEFAFLLSLLHQLDDDFRAFLVREFVPQMME